MADIDQSARALVDSFLASYNLEGLSDWAWGQYVGLGGGENALAQISLELPNQPAFKARYPAYEPLRQAGRAMSVDEMRAYERSAKQFMQAAGIPAGFYDQPSDFAQFLMNEVSVAELQQRVSIVADAVNATDPLARDALQRIYGIGNGELTAYFLDPSRALPLLQTQYGAGQQAATATRAGFGTLTREEAEQAYGYNQSPAQSAQTFGELAQMKPLFTQLAGDVDTFTQGQQLEAGFVAGGEQQQRAQTRRERRQARFQERGGFTASQGGVIGLKPPG